MLKAIHAQEDREEAQAKAEMIFKKLKDMKLTRAPDMVNEDIHETLILRVPPRASDKGQDEQSS